MNLLEKIFQAGIVGAGGAGFPTHLKLKTTVEYLLINAAECEPLLQTDKYIMRHYANEVVQAVCAVGELIEAKELIIAIKGVNKNEITAVEQAIQHYGVNVRVFQLDNYYPAGDEQMIVYDVTERIVPPGGIPLQVGVVVSNVATMLNIYDAMQNKPVTHKFLTVTGAVQNPAVLKVPIGTSFASCIQACGGATIPHYLAIDGGPMMGKPHTDKEIENLSVTKTTSGIIVMDERNFIGRLTHTEVKSILNRAKSACIQCTFCSEMCPRQLIGHPLHPHKVMRHMSNMKFNEELVPDDILEEALICCECGICETYACPMALSPRQVNIYVKREYAKKGIRYTPKKNDWKVSNVREYRKIVPSKIMARMGLASLYEQKANDYKEFSPQQVVIPLKQNIGSPSIPCVQENDLVQMGQIIATGDIDKPSMNLHASITGRVIKIENAITIQGGEV